MDRKKKFRQYRSNQGRPPQQQQSSEKLVFIALVGLLAMFILSIISNI